MVRAFVVAVVVVAAIGGFGVPVSVAVTARKGSRSSSSAAALLDSQSLGTAVGSPVFATTDLGGAGNGTGSFDSQATASTVSGVVLTFTLSSFANAKAAKQAYQNLTSGLSDASPIAGVGDQAVSSGQTAYVLKGAQVLQVKSALGQARVDQANQLKATGRDPSSLYAGLVPAALAAAKSVGAKLTGKSSNGTGYVLPRGALDPCAVPLATVEQIYGAKGSGSSAQHVLSENPPATECRYNVPGVGIVSVFVTSSDQLYNPAYPTDIYAEYARLSGGDSRSTTRATTSAYRVATLTASHSARAGAEPHAQIGDLTGGSTLLTGHDSRCTFSLAGAIVYDPYVKGDQNKLKRLAKKFADVLVRGRYKLIPGHPPATVDPGLTTSRAEVMQTVEQIVNASNEELAKADLQQLNGDLSNLKKAAEATCKSE